MEFQPKALTVHREVLGAWGGGGGLVARDHKCWESGMRFWDVGLRVWRFLLPTSKL